MSNESIRSRWTVADPKYIARVKIQRIQCRVINHHKIIETISQASEQIKSDQIVVVANKASDQMNSTEITESSTNPA